jgi:hypothetical protein
MIVFITLSSILLTGSLTGILSNSFSRVITHAREEYLYVYSVYVLEASTSNRLTHFFPPFNLIALFIFRPLRLFLPSDTKFRGARIVLLKATHVPVVALVKLYEAIRSRTMEDEFAGFKGPRADSARSTSQSTGQRRPPLGQHRPSSSYRPGFPSPRNSDQFLTTRRLLSRGAEDDATEEPPSMVEIRITELNRKIDNLTNIIMALQEQQNVGLSSEGSARH